MSSSKQPQDSNLTLTVLKALDVLELLASTEEPTTVAEVARRCGLSRPTAYRLLNTLRHRHYVTNNDDGHYQLGPRLLTLTSNLLESLDLHQIADPELQRLMQLSNETTHFAILDHTEALYVGKVESTQPVRMYSTVGARIPLHCTAIGKAILAFLPADDLAILLDLITLDRRTPNTITDKAVLTSHLELVREQGYAIDDIENEEGIRCIGAPVFNHLGRVYGAISISGLAYRLSRDKLEEFSSLVITAAGVVSSKLGYVPDDPGVESDPGTVHSV